MIVKGRYVGTIEFDFEVDLDEVGNVTPDEFRENLKTLNNSLQEELTPLFVENSEYVHSKLTVTQNYLDVYEKMEREE